MPPQLRMGLSVAVGVSLQWHRWCPGHIASCLKQGRAELIKNLSNFKPVFRFWYWNVTQHIVIQIWKSTLDIYFSSFNQPKELNKWLQCLLNSAKVGFQILSEAELSAVRYYQMLTTVCHLSNVLKYWWPHFKSGHMLIAYVEDASVEAEYQTFVRCLHLP